MVSTRDWFKMYHYMIVLKIIHFIKTVLFVVVDLLAMMDQRYALCKEGGKLI
jgi:hypothetical protein